jgi:uncharacterized protein
MFPIKVGSFVTGFILLFIVYHFPEFFSSFLLMAIFKIGFLVLAFFVARYQGWKGLEGYGLHLNNKWAIKLLAGVITGCLFFTTSIFISSILGYETITGSISYLKILSSLPLILLMTAVPSMAEDILTRGYLFMHLKIMKPAIWILMSSTIYLLNHIWRLDDGMAVLSYLFIFGIVLAVAVRNTKSLWLAFGIHWGANITFEVSNLVPKTENLSPFGASNWILALCWFTLLICLLIFSKKRGEIPALKI